MANDQGLSGNALQSQRDLEERLREVEQQGASVSSTLLSLSNNVSELKVMFQKICDDSSKLNEIMHKVEGMSKTEERYDELYRKFIVLENSHNMCQDSFTRRNEDLRNLIDKVNNIDGIKLTRIESSLEDLKTSKGKVEGFGGRIFETVVIIAVIYVIWLIAAHMQPTTNPVTNPPEIKSSISDMNKSTQGLAIAGTYSSSKK